MPDVLIQSQIDFYNEQGYLILEDRVPKKLSMISVQRFFDFRTSREV